MLTQEQMHRYEQDGFLVVKQLLTLEECQKLRGAIDRFVDDWEPEVYSWIFLSDEEKKRAADQRLVALTDATQCHPENEAIDPQTGKLNRDKHLSVGYIGNSLHKSVPECRTVAFSDKIKGIARDFEFIKPAIRQTMCIFKQPSIGGEWTPHRDSQYVYNEPFKVLGIWIALEDATIENGCLWFIPGSHLKPSNRRYIRNPNEQEFNEGNVLIYTGEEEQYDDNAYVPVEVKAGDAVLIHGHVVHKSAPNKSSVSRLIYALHLMEMHNSIYLKENWYQPGAPFSLLYDE